MMKIPKRALLTCGLMPLAMLVPPETALAQTESADDQLQDIIVTARKVSEQLQTTPIAVTAIDAEGLERKQIQQIFDLQRSTPNLTIGGGGNLSSSGVSLALRGQAQNSNNSASDAAVGIYIDGVYYGRPTSQNVNLFDVASAEILRGPQGTLFGRNTTGGAMNITTKQPTGEFEGYAKAGIGNFDNYEFEAVLNAPIHGDELATRIGLSYNEREGYGRNPVVGRDLANVNSDLFVKASVKWEPAGSPLTLLINGDYSRYKDDGSLTAIQLNLPFVFLPANSLAVGFPPNDITLDTLFAVNGLPNPEQYNNTKSRFYESYGFPNSNIPMINTPFNRNRAKGLSAAFDIELGDFQIRSITAYRESATENSMDLDGTPLQVVAYQTQYKQKQFSEELQLSAKFGDLDVIGGIFYFKESGTEQSDNQILQALSGPIFGMNAPHFRSLADFRAISLGLFSQLNYQITDRLRATGGFRYTWDTRKLNRHGLSDVDAGICGVGPNRGLVVGEACNDPQNAKFSYPAWVASVDYEIDDDTFVYLKTSGASMAGGFNTRPTPPNLDSFKPENVKDIEAGIKTDLLDRRLRLNLATFHAWRNNVQNIVNEFLNGAITQYSRNAGNVRAYGIEFEGTLLPWSGMEITTAAAYLHTKYQDGSFQVQGVDGLVDRSGERVLQAPRWTLNVGATQSFDVPIGKVSVHADYSYVASNALYQDTVDPNNPAQSAEQYAVANELGVVKGYGLLNARVAMDVDASNIEAAFWARNLTKTQYFVSMFDAWTSLGLQTNYQGSPRTYGMSVTVRW